MIHPERSRTQKLLAEFAGTFAVVFVGAGAVAAGAYWLNQGRAGYLPQRLTGALLYGAAYGAAIALLGRISGGHFNPAVSIAHWVTHRAGTFATLFYFVAQMAGATAAAYALRLILPEGATSAVMIGPPVLAADLTRGPALLIEGGMAFALVLAFWGTLVNRARPRYWLGGLIVGGVLAAGSYLGSPYTGGVANPARAFGLAMAARLWGYQQIYWVGPLAGAVAAATLCDPLFRRNLHGSQPVPKTSTP
jgi:aquaporin Z